MHSDHISLGARTDGCCRFLARSADTNTTASAAQVELDRFVVLGYSVGSVIVDVLFLPPAEGSYSTATSKELAQALDAQARDERSVLRTQGKLSGTLAPGGLAMNVAPAPTPAPPVAVIEPLLSFRDEVIVYACVALAVELLMTLFTWGANR